MACCGVAPPADRAAMHHTRATRESSADQGVDNSRDDIPTGQYEGMFDCLSHMFPP